MQKYYNLKYAFNNCFSYESEADIEICKKWLKESIQNNEVNITDLRLEYEDILLNDKFNLVEFAFENKLIEDKNSFSNEDIRQLIIYGIEDFIFPEKVKNLENIQNFINSATIILKDYSANDGWMLRKELYKKLINLDMFKNYEEYHLFDIVAKSKYIIENKFEFGKREQRVYLRFRR